MNPDDCIRAILAENPQATSWEVAEVLVDQDVSSGVYAGCSTDLELAFQEYQSKAEEIISNG